MVNNCVVQGCVVGMAKQTVMAAFRIDDSKPLGAATSLPCVQSTLCFS